jgi:heme-degrading monooxygenase HmoA
MSKTSNASWFTYVWSYEVRDDREADFERLYGPNGGWAQFFRKSPNYLGTDLLRDRKIKNRYITVDRWDSEEAHRRFVSEHREEFDELDRQGEALTKNESLIGNFDPAGT